MAKADIERQEALEQENKILREKIASQEALQSDMQNALGDSLSNEMKKIRAKGKSSANTIRVEEHHDHKNITLWTKWGKQIGPLHPDNAIQTLNRFADIGIRLSADKPTPAQLEAYCKTPEYKAMIKKEEERRKERAKSRKTGQMEKLAAEIAIMSGTTVEAINHIFKASEVKTK